MKNRLPIQQKNIQIEYLGVALMKAHLCQKKKECEKYKYLQYVLVMR